MRVAVVGEKDDVRIEVGNSGPAISGETLVELFEPLSEAPPTSGILVWVLACI